MRPPSPDAIDRIVMDPPREPRWRHCCRFLAGRNRRNDRVASLVDAPETFRSALSGDVESFARLPSPRSSIEEEPVSFWSANGFSTPTDGGQQGNSTPSEFAQRESKRNDLLVKILAVERHCRRSTSDLAGGRGELNLKVECLLQSPTAQTWLCRDPVCPVVTACVHVRLADVNVEDALFAITDPTERLEWDAESFKLYQILKPVADDGDTMSEILWCVASAPWPFRDRDFLQKRWYMPLPDGGRALLIQSFEDSSVKPQSKDYVRATTHYSGYLMRPRGDGELEITIISRADLGGAIPASAQNVVNRLAKQRPVMWAQRLGAHCRHMKERRR